MRWGGDENRDCILKLMPEPKKMKVQGGEAFYFGQLNEENQMHGKGVLFIAKQKYLYYGFFRANEKHGYGREFYDEVSFLNNFDQTSRQRKILEAEFKQWFAIFG